MLDPVAAHIRHTAPTKCLFHPFVRERERIDIGCQCVCVVCSVSDTICKRIRWIDTTMYTPGAHTPSIYGMNDALAKFSGMASDMPIASADTFQFHQRASRKSISIMVGVSNIVTARPFVCEGIQSFPFAAAGNIASSFGSSAQTSCCRCCCCLQSNAGDANKSHKYTHTHT